MPQTHDFLIVMQNDTGTTICAFYSCLCSQAALSVWWTWWAVGSLPAVPLGPDSGIDPAEPAPAPAQGTPAVPWESRLVGCPHTTVATRLSTL